MIRILTEADEAALTELLTDGQIKKTYMLPDFDRREDALPLARRLVGLSQEESHFVRGICAEGILVGFLNDVEMEGRRIELGYVVHPRFWGRGYATDALKLAIRELFSRGWQEVTAGAFSENIASIRVMEKAGMLRTEKRETVEYRGICRRCVFYSIRQL